MSFSNRGTVQCLENIRLLPETLELIENETTLLKRVLYKNKNQHRNCHYFQYLAEIQRHLAKIDWTVLKATMMEECMTILTAFVLKSDSHQMKWGQLNGILKKQLDKVLRLTQQVSLPIAQLIQRCLKAYSAFSSQFCMTFFMNLSLASMAILARLHTCLRLVVVRLVQVHDTLILLYMRETCRANPLHVSVTAAQLKCYQLPSEVFIV